MHNHLEVLMLLVTGIIKEKLKLTRWRGMKREMRNEMDRGNDKSGSEISANNEGNEDDADVVEMLWKVSTKDLQNGANAAAFSLPFLCSKWLF